MRRIFHFIGLIGFLWAALYPPRAEAEVVGALMPTPKIPYYVTAHNAFREELEKLGFDLNKTEIVLQRPAPSVMAWKNTARRFLVLEASVIVSYGAATTLAVIEEKLPVPIVFSSAFDPDGLGIRGSNITGTNTKVSIQTLLKHFKSIANFKSLAIVYSKEERDSIQQADMVAGMGAQFDFRPIKFDVKEEDEDYTLPQAEAIFLTTASPTMRQKNLKTIVSQAREKKMASAALLSGTNEFGVLITYSADPVLDGKKVARMVAEILRGKHPSSIPVDNDPEFELTINLKEAEELGLTVPPDLLKSAKTIK